MSSTTTFAKPVVGGSFFKAADHMTDLAILIEPKKILKDQKTVYEGIESLRDVAICDIACFRTQEDVENEKPSTVMIDGQITNQVLVSDIERNDWIGKQALVIIQKSGRSYVYREPTFAGAEAAAIAYFDKRNATEAEALADAPDFG